MAKYVARVRKSANSYRYFYSPAEYQAYLKSKGNGKTLGEKLTGAVDTAKTKARKYVYNKNAAKKVDDMGKAHERDERSKQGAREKPTPGAHRDTTNWNSTINRRTYEAVQGTEIKKKDGEYVSTANGSGLNPKDGKYHTTESNFKTPNVGKMQDAIAKSLKEQQHKSTQAKKYAEMKRQKQKENYERIASGKAADAKAKAEVEAQRKPAKPSVTNHMHQTATNTHSGHAKPNANIKETAQAVANKPKPTGENSKPKPSEHTTGRTDNQQSRIDYANSNANTDAANEYQAVTAALHNPANVTVMHNPNTGQAVPVIKPDQIGSFASLHNNINQVQQGTSAMANQLYNNTQNELGSTEQTPLSYRNKTKNKKKYVK